MPRRSQGEQLPLGSGKRKNSHQRQEEKQEYEEEPKAGEARVAKGAFEAGDGPGQGASTGTGGHRVSPRRALICWPPK